MKILCRHSCLYIYIYLQLSYSLSKIFYNSCLQQLNFLLFCRCRTTLTSVNRFMQRSPLKLIHTLNSMEVRLYLSLLIDYQLSYDTLITNCMNMLVSNMCMRLLRYTQIMLAKSFPVVSCPLLSQVCIHIHCTQIVMQPKELFVDLRQVASNYS